ncbi:MAG: hypothetical protein K2H53_06635 [Clostridia bacterium]|nr:hypothetical protein [Clostridia bacterium]
MVDVKKILGLNSEERDLLKELIKLHDEAERAVGIIYSTWKFKMNESELNLTDTTTELGFKNRLTHDGKWIITIDDEDKTVCIDKEIIYKLFEADYLVKKQFKIEDEEKNKEFHDAAKLGEYFRCFWNATRKRA